MSTHAPVIIDELFGELELPTDERQWFVARTKPRCEKKLAQHARRNEIHYYLPLMKSKKIYQKRKVEFTKPLFPGYLFVCMNFNQKQTLLISGFSAGFLPVKHQQHLLDELKALHKIPDDNIKIGYQYWLSSGLEVKIISGPFAGSIGVVESHDKIDEVRLQVDILRQAVLVRINPRDVEIIGKYEIVEV